MAIKAGVPENVPAYTVNRLCGTGVQAIVSAAQAIQTGDAEVALAGGAESIGPVPSVRKVMERTGRSLDDVQVIELNEAFAAQALAVIDELGPRTPHSHNWFIYEP